MSVAIVGLGTICCSWVALFLSKGWHVLATDPQPEAKQHLFAYLERILPFLLKDATSTTADEAQSRCRFVPDFLPQHLENVTFVQENGPENLEIKTTLISKLDKMTPAGTPIASSSSGLAASAFIAQCKHDPSRILIGHPFNPPHIVPLVEVVPHCKTDGNIIKRTVQFYEELGKVPVVIKRELPGFVANRLQAAINSEAFSLVKRGVISAEDLDKVVTSGLGPRWAAQGPFLTNILAGGQGGFGHHLRHLGPNRAVWMDDMIQHRFNYLDETSITQLEESCQELLERAQATGLEELEAQRDQRLGSILSSAR